MLLKRNSLALVVSGAIAGLTLGGATAYWWLNQQHPLPPEVPFGADVLPQTTLATVSFSTNQSQWQQLQTLGTAETQIMLQDQLGQWRDRLLTNSGYTYAGDIQPWIGQEVTLAIVPIAANPDRAADDVPLPSDTQQSTVVLVPIADPAQAQALLATPADQTAARTHSTYKGLTINRMQPNDANPYLSTVLNAQTLVIAEDERAIQQVIDTFKGATSIADDSDYRQAFEQVSVAEPFVRLYVNGPAAKAQLTTTSLSPIPPLQGLTPVQTNQGMVATMILNKDGVQMRGVNWLPSNSKTRYEVDNRAGRMPTLLPDTTLLMMSGGSFTQTWQSMNQSSEITPDQLANPNVLQQAIRTMTGLEPEQDLLPWMDGEFTLALVPAVAPGKASNGASDGSGNESQGGTGVVFMVKAGDRRAADNALVKLDQTMTSRYKFDVSEGRLDDSTVVNWASPFRAVTATRGWLSDNVAYLAFNSAVAEALVPKPDAPLSDSALFRQATASSLNPNNGHFFVNVEGLLQSGRGLPIPSLPRNGDAIIRAIRAIGLTTAIASDRTTRYDMTVLLQRLEAAPSASPNSEILPPESFPLPATSP